MSCSFLIDVILYLLKCILNLLKCILLLMFFLQIFLDKYSSKSAQFRIVPRYKVKAESELVCPLLFIILDEIL